MEKEKIKSLISQMTLEEKAGMCSGADFWSTKAVERLGIPSVAVSDGPHGLRKQSGAADHMGLNSSIEAVCFPAGCATAASFDRELLTQLGETLGEECQAENISTILGPAMNIKRSPLCGRNFEYYSEDPLVSTQMGGALIKGVQRKNVGTSPKHYVANNQEYRRMISSSDLDERTLREIYLASFEGAVIQQKPWTVMNSYNKVNGTFVGESKELLTDILREEWGFDGYVMTDWGAINDRAAALEAGCELEMPSSGGVNDAEIIKAVQDDVLEEEVLDRACERLLNIIFRYTENRDESAVFDLLKDHETARHIEEECIVLLKNENDILPLSADQNIAFIGKFADNPRFQGGGSSHINSFKVESALAAVENITKVTYAQGYDDKTDVTCEHMIAEAVNTAKEAKAAVIFAGLPSNFDSEGYDRKHMRMPDNQNALIEAVAEVQPNTIVVLHNGSPVEMPWIDRVKGVIEAYLGGQAVGGAVVRVLFGMVNPGGRLPETFPLRAEDTPCYLFYGGENDHSEYREGVFVGYRYYSSKKMPVLFPFGYGLSYTTFTYSNLTVAQEELKDTEALKISVEVTNTGKVPGKEVVQIYVSPVNSRIIRPVRELREFFKVSLESGETKTVSFTLDKRAFAYWNTQIHDWHVETGSYEIQVGRSAEDIVLAETVRVKYTVSIPKVFTLNSTMGEIMSDPKGKAIMENVMGPRNTESQTQEKETAKDQEPGAMNDEMAAATMADMPLRQLLSFVPGMKRESLEQLVAALNA